ncbi:HAMP domain-containing histidine kinase [Synechococcus sp. RSCCF101]|uniref:sensor histidine kinase n=1 Tax=Synechococcus sp. RSCCF101 TaxID=2511069 RepID=UPI001248412D|nr:HAMP domain-containing sensor histidine kinase [Synechococcus sp. RSCCF101]QEY32287.1 HAMP domain-containing histidine kinase [Synechococcus sp. RSCCF101]
MSEPSPEFRRLVSHQLRQFADCSELNHLIVYAAGRGEDGKLHLATIGSWPDGTHQLPPAVEDGHLPMPGRDRRWWALRRDTVLLGALRAEIRAHPWRETLLARLQACADTLTEALLLEHERVRLEQDLDRQQDQIAALVHQLRNPLAALRTFAQLLLRRMDAGDRQRPLVESLLSEQRQLGRYVDAIGVLGATAGPERRDGGMTEAGSPLLPPPADSGDGSRDRLAGRLAGLCDRAAARAALQGRSWLAPDRWPRWEGDADSVAEIVANLIDNAFHYAPSDRAIGMAWIEGEPEDGLRLCVWDGGEAIAAGERERIFRPGERGARSAGRSGTGRGLALARDLAHGLGGTLTLHCPPRRLDPRLPEQGNVFCLKLPAAIQTPQASSPISSSASDSDHSTQAP